MAVVLTFEWEGFAGEPKFSFRTLHNRLNPEAKKAKAGG